MKKSKLIKAAIAVVLTLGVTGCMGKTVAISEVTSSSAEAEQSADMYEKVLDDLMLSGCMPSGTLCVQNISCEGGYIYYTKYVEEEKSYVLYAADASNGGKVKVSESSDVKNYCTLDGSLYFAQSGDIYKANLDGTNAKLLVTLEGDMLGNIHLFTSSGKIKVFAQKNDVENWMDIYTCEIDADGKQLTALAKTDVPAFTVDYVSTGVPAASVNGEMYYFTESFDNKTFSVTSTQLNKRDGDAYKILQKFDDTLYAEFSAADDKYLYCTTATGRQDDGFVAIGGVCRFNTVDGSIETFNLPVEKDGSYLMAVPAAHGDTVYAIYATPATLSQNSDNYFGDVSEYTLYRYSIETGTLTMYGGISSASVSFSSGSASVGQNGTELSSDMLDVWRTLGGRWVKDNYELIDFSEYDTSGETYIAAGYQESEYVYSGYVRKAENLGGNRYCFYIDIPEIPDSEVVPQRDAETGYLIVDTGAPGDGKADMKLYIEDAPYSDKSSFAQSAAQGAVGFDGNVGFDGEFEYVKM